jgi:hypothetical protein
MVVATALDNDGAGLADGPRLGADTTRVRGPDVIGEARAGDAPLGVTKLELETGLASA